MLKLIRADFYRLFHRAYVYGLLGGLAGLSVLVNFMISRSGEYAIASFSWEFALEWLSLPLMLMPMLADIVFAEEYKEHTLKNIVANGTNRIALYLSKTVTSVLLGLLLAAVMLGVYCASSLLFLDRDPQFTQQLVREFFQRIGVACAVYIAGLTLANLFTVLFRRSSLSMFVYYGAVFFSPYLFRLLRLEMLQDYLLANQTGVVAKAPMAQLSGPLEVSAVTAAVCIVFGFVFFYRQDVD